MDPNSVIVVRLCKKKANSDPINPKSRKKMRQKTSGTKLELGMGTYNQGELRNHNSCKNKQQFPSS